MDELKKMFEDIPEKEVMEALSEIQREGARVTIYWRKIYREDYLERKRYGKPK